MFVSLPIFKLGGFIEDCFPALVIASEHANWLPPSNIYLQAITCYVESSTSANVLTEIQDSFGNKIPMITTAMQPECKVYLIYSIFLPFRPLHLTHSPFSPTPYLSTRHD
jgi:hypothetical protein